MRCSCCPAPSGTTALPPGLYAPAEGTPARTRAARRPRSDQRCPRRSPPGSPRAVPVFDGELAGTVVHVAVDNIYAGYILIADDIKSDSAHAIKELKNSNIKQIIMLTGDSVNVGENVGKELGLSKVYAELLPADKVEKLEELLSQTSGKGRLAYVGDGINDVPALQGADVHDTAVATMEALTTQQHVLGLSKNRLLHFLVDDSGASSPCKSHSGQCQCRLHPRHQTGAQQTGR